MVISFMSLFELVYLSLSASVRLVKLFGRTYMFLAYFNKLSMTSYENIL